MTAADRSVRAQLAGTVEQRQTAVASPVELRSVPDGTGGSKVRISGYGSVTEVAYEMVDAYGSYDEVVARGAFKKTLSGNPPVVFLANHQGIALAATRAGTLRLSDDSTGLHFEADLDPARPDVVTLRSAVESGAANEASFAFRVPSGGQQWDEEFEHRRILECDLRGGDVSICNFGANGATAGLASVTMRRKGVPEAAGRPRGPRPARIEMPPPYTTVARERLRLLRSQRP